MKFSLEFAIGILVAIGTTLFSLGASFFVGAETIADPEATAQHLTETYLQYLYLGLAAIIIAFIVLPWIYRRKNASAPDYLSFDPNEKTNFTLATEACNRLTTKIKANLNQACAI